jgi:hypothetical protein
MECIRKQEPESKMMIKLEEESLMITQHANTETLVVSNQWDNSIE